MAILLKVVGLVLAIGGISAAGLGWPYRMIDWGNIQVVLGGLAFVGGLILAALGFVQGSINRLRDSLSGLASTAAFPELAQAPEARFDAPVLPGGSADIVAYPASRFGPGTAVLAGATAAAAAGAVAISQAGPDTAERSTSIDKMSDDAAFENGKAAALLEGAEASAKPGDNRLAPAAFETVATAEPQDQSPVTIADAGSVPISLDETTTRLSLDALTARINEAAGDLTALRRGVVEPASELAGDPEGAVHTDESSAVAAGQSDNASTDEDEPTDVPHEQELPGLVQKIALPEDFTLASDIAESTVVNEAELPDIATVDQMIGKASDETEPLRDDVLHAVELAATEVLVPATILDSEPELAALEPAQESDSTLGQAADDSLTDDADTSTTADADPADAVGPAANAEGVVSVHRIGDATYTMFVDGTIRAETPNGAFGFATVAELKTYLAGDKSVARPLD